MTASTLYDRAKMTVSSTGTGTITLNAAVAGYRTFAAAGVASGTVVSYVIEDASNTWEIGQGTYTSSGTTLTRGAIASSNSNAAISMTSAAVVYITARSVDLQSNVAITGGTVSVTSLTCSASGSFQGITFGLGASSSSTNLAIGASVLTNNTTGTYNIGIGLSALSANTGGYNNTAIGATACFSNVNGTGLVGVGLYALYGCNSSYNTGIGAGAGYDVSGGAANTFLGYNTGRGITSGSNNTVLGAQVTGLSSGLTGAVILATGDGTIQMDYNASLSGKWSIGAGATSIQGRTLLATLTASSSSSLTNSSVFTSTYNRYKIVINNLVASAACDLSMQLFNVTGSNVTAYTGTAVITGGGNANITGTGSSFPLTYSAQWAAGAPGLSAEIDLVGIQKQPGVYVEAHSIHKYSSSAYEFVWMTGTIYNTTNVDGIYFAPSTGTLTSGTILIYGVNE